MKTMQDRNFRTLSQLLPDKRKTRIYNLSASVLKGRDRDYVTLSDTLASILIVKNEYLYANNEIYFPKEGEWTFSQNASVAVTKNARGEILWGELE